MNAYLMHRDADADLAPPLPPNTPDLEQDLGLRRLFEAMAVGDRFLYDVSRHSVLSGLTDPEAIVYRQHVLADCITQAATVRTMYAVAVAAVEGERRVWRSVLARYPEAVLHESLELMRLFMTQLRALRAMADEHATGFHSAGFTAFFARLRRELDAGYFATVDAHLRQLEFRHGLLVRARLAQGGKGTAHTVLRPRPRPPRWRQWLPFRDRSPYTLVIAERDETGFKALGELRGRSINLVASALAQSADHILSFFTQLRAELGFYVACLNLRERLVGKKEPVCFPVPCPPGDARLSARGLYEVGLGLAAEERVVGNEIRADGASLVMVTGANQGGKSTFLRSLGLAQLMMQAGMFVGAEAFEASVATRLVTHYKREEDATMTSGKLDEELGRMSRLVERLRPGSVALFNESFAATNEREGAEIAGTIVRALRQAGTRVCFVTHSFELASGLHAEGTGSALFLRAERQPDGRRTFKLVEGAPRPTGYGEDLYRRIFRRDREPEAIGA
jgi:hypothetical protein